MKRKYLWLGLGIGLGVVAAIFLDPTYVLRGYLQGEKFYRGRPVSYWRQTLKSQDPAVQAEVFNDLKEGGESAVPVLVVLLSGGETPEVRWQAANLLGRIGPEAREATGLLIAALKDDDPHVRSVAATSLEAIVPKEAADEAVPQLTALVATGGPASVAAARALSRFGAAASPAIPVLLEALKDGNSEVRWNAARTLGKIGAAAKEAVPKLVEVTKDKEAKVREHAAEALGDIGPEAKEAVPALIAVLKDPVPRVRRDAARALGQIGPGAKAALPSLKGLLEDKDTDVRQAAARAVRILDSEVEKGADP